MTTLEPPQVPPVNVDEYLDLRNIRYVVHEPPYVFSQVCPGQKVLHICGILDDIDTARIIELFLWQLTDE